MTEEEKQQKIRDFFKGLARDGNVQVLVPDPPPGGTVHARLTPDGAIMCQTVEGGEREIELCEGDEYLQDKYPDAFE